MTDAGAPVQNILVYVDGDLMGDGLMKLPMIRRLRQACPQARITWCAGRYRSIFAAELAPFVRGLLDEIIEEAGIFDRSRLFRRPLDGRYFDLVIDTQNSIVKTLLLRRIRHGRFISHAGGFLLSDRRPPASDPRPASLSERLTGLAGLAVGTLPSDMPAAPLPIEESSLSAAATALPEGPVYIGFAPGAGGQHKCWPLEHYIALADRQSDKGRTPVFILGPGEERWADRIAQALPTCLIPSSYGPSPAGESAAKRCSASPGFTVAIARRLAAAVANDSGCGHLLAAADVPLVSLFGSTSAKKFRPASRRHELIEAQSFGAGSIGEIPVTAVETAVERLLTT